MAWFIKRLQHQIRTRNISSTSDNSNISNKKNCKRKFDESFMTTREELNEREACIDEEEANMGLMTSLPSDSESDSNEKYNEFSSSQKRN